ncbi:phosphotransferase enzyme family protein [Ktedonobacter racemifer]|uniref:phosphotransferase enzyme family protein n=1 Tax=Ktedonobacter racemifer TaxID=363277 RepID=UPI00146EB21E|nr:phosphotransferase [Ktedonobacter racemifer]
MEKLESQAFLHNAIEHSQPIFPATHSILSSEALLAEVSTQYPFEPFVACSLLKSKLNDTYLLRTEHERYILRVYRAHWRSLSEIHYELDLLLHLANKGIGVSFPLARKDGALLGSVCAPEGIRYLVIFTYAPGKPFYGEAMFTHSQLLGQVIANIHLGAADFASSYERICLDLDYLLDHQFEALSSLLAHRPQDWEYLVSLAKTLREYLMPLIEQGLSRGSVMEISSAPMHISLISMRSRSLILIAVDPVGWPMISHTFMH